MRKSRYSDSQRTGASVRLVCQAFGISETCYRYRPILSDENAPLAGRAWLRASVKICWQVEVFWSSTKGRESHRFEARTTLDISSSLAHT